MRWSILLWIMGLLFIAVVSGESESTARKASEEKRHAGEEDSTFEIYLPEPNQQPNINDQLKPTVHAVRPANDLERSINDETEGSPKATTGDGLQPIPSQSGVKQFTSARILVLLPLPFYSHTENYLPIFKELARRGHKITMVSPYPQKEPLPNWEDIVTENVIEKIWARLPTRDFTELSNSFIHKLQGTMFMAEIAVQLFAEMPPLQQLYTDDSREFDLVIGEFQFVQEPLLAFAWKHKVPVISMYPSFIVPEVAYYTGNPVFTSTYVPNMVFDTTNNMNFLERFKNTAYVVLKLILYNVYYLPKMDSYMRKYFPSSDVPYIGDLLFNVSFTLMDSNPVLVYPYPRVNNMKDFLGISNKGVPPLDAELQSIMDGADKDGVLLFTLGSHFQTSTLKPHVLDALVYAFSKIPQTVIMKWDLDEALPNLPANVHSLKWVPQAGILRHRNCRGFLTHTGVHGLMEAMDNKVPVISLPLFADQYFLAAWVEENGVGKVIDHKSVTPEDAFTVIKEVINNPKYKENAISVSMMLKDLPLPKIDEVVYWIEHVLRTKGARHLRPGSLNLRWYQRFGLDVLSAALLLTVIPIWLIIYIIRTFVSVICRRKSKDAEEKEKKKKKKIKQT